MMQECGERYVKHMEDHVIIKFLTNIIFTSTYGKEIEMLHEFQYDVFILPEIFLK